ncbi:MAG: NifB/NifX family molybdenum-iron cluster-binding protein [Smithellaceae bacterium]
MQYRPGAERYEGMKVALSVWNKDISTVFDSADQLLVLDLDGADCRKQTIMKLSAVDVLGRANQIKEKKIDVLICGAISRSLEYALTSQGIRVYAFVRGSVEEVLAAYKNGELGQAVFALPGCHRRRNAENRRCNRGKRRF